MSSSHWQREDEDLALALALSASISEQEKRTNFAPPLPPGLLYPGRPPAPVQTNRPVQQSPASERGIGLRAIPHSYSNPEVRRPPVASIRPVQNSTGQSSNSCPGCGISVLWSDQHVMALGKKWHPACLRCGLCSDPLISGSGRGSQFANGSDGKLYHLECHKTKFHPICTVCDNFIRDTGGRIEFKELQFWKDRYCMHHIIGTADVVQCCSCSRLRAQRGPQWVSLSDGRDLCLECVSSIVVDTRDAQPLYDEVLAFYRTMGMNHPQRAPFMLVDSRTLNEYSDKEGRDSRSGPIFHVRGLTLATIHRSIPTIVRTIGGPGLQVSSVSTPLMDRATTTCSVSAILVMYGLPRLLTGCIIAHELMHAWLRMRHIANLDSQTEEGLCQLMAMLWLDHQNVNLEGDAIQQRLASYFGYQIREDTSTVYGDGFRIAYEAFQRNGGGMRGLNAVINNVLKTQRLC